MIYQENSRRISRQEAVTETEYVNENITMTQMDTKGRCVSFSVTKEVNCLVNNEIKTIEKKSKPARNMVYVSPYATKLDVVSRILFPCSFACFNLVFWLCYGNHTHGQDPNMNLCGA